MSRSKAFALLTATTIAVSVGVGVAPAAEAGSGTCGGSLIARKVAHDGNGTAVGELVVYYNSSTGNNCARFNHLGPSYGVARETNVFIERCLTNNPNNDCFNTGGPSDYDNGTYAYYAGPVSVHAPNKCVRAFGYILWNGARRNAETVTGC